ncbi:ABC transporter [Colletotrichum musicola]|uniref:ABC transporter n=1 Tax=Colletotrichum musicola TaxID=2175873 RepID=A0A8H6KFN8_9PEZI|nr:ABC transporter [Colletotrichum musicola]
MATPAGAADAADPAAATGVAGAPVDAAAVAAAAAAAAAAATPEEPKRAWWKLSTKNVTALRNFIRILSYGTWYDKLIIALSVLGAIGAGLTLPIMNIVFGQLVGTFTGFFKQGTQETQEEFTKAVNQGVLYIVYLFIGRLLMTYFSNLGFRMTSIRISAAIRLAYLRALFEQPISVLDMLAPGSTAAIITITASILQLGISEKVGDFFSSLSVVIAGFTIAFAYNWLLTLTTASGLVFIMFVYMFTAPPIVKRLKDVQDIEILAASVSTEAFGSIRMLAACGAEFKMIEKYGALADQSRRRGAGMAWLVAFQQGLIFFAIYATFALSFWYAFQMYTMMSLTTPTSLIVVLLCIMMMASSIGQLTAPLSAASQAADANGIFHTIIDAPKPTYGKLKAPEASAEGDIVFQNVNFVYPKRPDVKILENLSLQFPAGKVTAIVGPSGSGKSTIVGILERWYEFNGDLTTNQMTLWLRNGIISCGGRLLSEIDPQWWRSQIGLVQQDNALFNTTIFKNVEYGLIGTEWEHEDDSVKAKLIEMACKDAFADEFITRLPEGYQTEVGDAGIKLSGGQRQRLAIARAIVKQPKILILDEATSAIDVRSEQIVQAALDRACRGRTTIVIAHRLGTIKKADNIILLRKGQVVQQGTHQSLMAEVGGAYHTLATAQKLDMGAEDEDEDVLFGDLSWRRPEPESNSLRKPHLPFGSSEGDLTMTEKRPSTDAGASGDVLVAERDGSDDEIERREAGSLRVINKPRGIVGRWKAWRPFGNFGLLLGEQRKRWKTYVVIAIAALGAGASTPVQAYLFAVLVSLFSYWGTFLRVIANHWCIMFVYLATGVGVSHFLLGWATTTIGFGITRVYRKEYFRNILYKPSAFFDGEGNSAGALTARLATDPTMLQQLLGTNMAFVLISLFNVIGCIVVGLVFGWKLTLVALGTSMPIIVAAMFYRVRHETKFEEANNEVFAESAKFASESIGAIRTVSSLTMEDGICQRYDDLLKYHTRDAFRKSRWSVMVFAFSDSISLLCMAFVLWYGGRLLSSHEYTPFQYMVVYIAVVQGGMSAGQWLSFGPNIAKAKTAADRIVALRDNDDDDTLPPGRVSDVVPYEVHYEKGVEIDFKDVWFSYPTRPTPVLKGLDLHIERGQFAAIVGPSGSGKTTIISLLERFYHLRPNGGEIFYNGHDVSTLELSKYRQNISLVAQEPSLFTGSIRDNILLGIENEASVSDDALHAAARDAGIHDFIASLPEGYNTAVGQSGVALSGGQKQRVSIARALIRRPSLLLLDEATSSLDSETERAVQAVFDATKGQRTMIMVAHRLATVQNADVIFVMADGKVVERGDHASLIAERGVYFQMALDK